MSERPRSDSTQDADEGDDRMVPTTVTSDGERVVVVTPNGMGVAPHDPEPPEPASASPTRPTSWSTRPR